MISLPTGIESVRILDAALDVLFPRLPDPPSEIEISLWLRDFNADPWHIAAVFADMKARAVNSGSATKPIRASYLAAALRNASRPDAESLPFETTTEKREYVEHVIRSVQRQGLA